MTSGRLGIVAQWHQAVNTGAADRAGALCTVDVEVGGPRGTGRGRSELVEWVRHAGIRLEPVRWFCGPAGAVVEQDARWRDPATGALGDPVRLATAFGFAGGRIARVLRYADSPSALRALGLDSADQVTRHRDEPDRGIFPE
jgi:hypothetical protein